jgi:hypothetical protein
MVAVIGRTKVSPTFKHEEFDPIVAAIFWACEIIHAKNRKIVNKN